MEHARGPVPGWPAHQLQLIKRSRSSFLHCLQFQGEGVWSRVVKFGVETAGKLSGINNNNNNKSYSQAR